MVAFPMMPKNFEGMHTPFSLARRNESAPTAEELMAKLKATQGVRGDFSIVPHAKLHTLTGK